MRGGLEISTLEVGEWDYSQRYYLCDRKSF